VSITEDVDLGRPESEYDPSAFRHVFETSFTWAAGFARNVHRYAGRVAMVDGTSGRTWTYAELGDITGALVAGLAARAPSDRGTSWPIS
jgi:hypothetical protein